MATYSGRLGRIGDGLWMPWICLLGWFIAAAPLHAQITQYDQFNDYDLAMFDRPKLSWKVEGSVSYGEGLKELWARALERPDPELQRLVIDTLALAHQRGVQGIGQLKPKLVEMAKVPNQSLDVVRSLAMTLIAFDARDEAQLLADLATQYGATVSQIVEPAIAVTWSIDPVFRCALPTSSLPRKRRDNVPSSPVSDIDARYSGM